MTDYRVAKGEVQEDQITAAIEKCTAQVPSSVYLALALEHGCPLITADRRLFRGHSPRHPAIRLLKTDNH